MPSRRALIVEDDEDMRTVLANAGRAAGFEVQEASCAADVSSLAEQPQGAFPFDIVVSDIAMPGTDGIELTRLLRRNMPWLPVILVSGFTPRGVLAAATEAGARTVLAKPVDPFVLRTLMAAYCAETG